MKYLPIVFLVFIAILSQADDNHEVRTIIISGGGTPKSNHPRYYSVSKLANEVSEKKGWPVHVSAADGSWDFIKNKNRISPAEEKGQVRETIRNATKGMKVGNSAVVFITDHGIGPLEGEEPQSGGLVLYRGSREKKTPENLTQYKEQKLNKNLSPEEKKKKEEERAKREKMILSHGELGSYLDSEVPKGVNVKLLGVHCFSGGAHHISFERPNTCSSMGTSIKHCHISHSKDKPTLFAAGFWNAVKKNDLDFDGNKEVGLYEAHVAALLNDTKNSSRGQISSSAYIDHVLSGLNSKKQDEESEGGEKVEKEEEEDNPEMDMKGVYETLRNPFPAPIGLSSFVRRSLQRERNQCIGSVTPSFKFDRLTDEMDNIITQNVEDIEPKAQETSKDEDDEETPLPPELQKVSDNVQKWWDENAPQFLPEAEAFGERYQELKKEYSELDGYTKRQKNAEYVKKFEENESEAHDKVTKFLVYLRMMKDVEKAKNFLNNKSVTEEQKKKFLELHKCEWEKL